MTKQSEAHRLADVLMTLFPSREDGERAAAELRRLSAENESLRQIVQDFPPVEAELREVSDRAHRLEAQRDALLEALQALYDEQNGPPLIRHQAAWEAAMEKARAALREALPVQEPAGRVVSANCEYATVQWLKQTSDVGGGDPKNSRSWPIAGDAVYIAPLQQDLPAEPVGSVLPSWNMELERIQGTWAYLNDLGKKLPVDTLLYAEPPQRSPLTEDEAWSLIEQDYRMEEYGDAAMELIRRTERAHGIMEEK